MTGFVLVALGAALGAPARYLMDRAVQERHEGVVPWGTMLVNLTGSLVLGLLVGLSTRGLASAEVMVLAGTGFCGAFTTYSTLAYETFRLADDGRWMHAAAVQIASIAGGLGAAGIGYAIGTML